MTKLGTPGAEFCLSIAAPGAAKVLHGPSPARLILACALLSKGRKEARRSFDGLMDSAGQAMKAKSRSRRCCDASIRTASPESGARPRRAMGWVGGRERPLSRSFPGRGLGMGGMARTASPSAGHRVAESDIPRFGAVGSRSQDRALTSRRDGAGSPGHGPHAHRSRGDGR